MPSTQAAPNLITPPSPAREGCRIIFLYAAFSACWILLSDKILAGLVTDPATLTTAANLKGWGFVLVTSVMLHCLLRRVLGESRQARQREQEMLADKLRTLNLLDALLEGSTDAIFLKDTAGRYMLANHATCNFVGRPSSAILGLDDRALFPANDAVAMMEEDRRMLDAGRPLTYEDEVDTPGGQRTFLTTKGPVRDGKGRIIGLFGIARDITPRKLAEAAVRDSEARYRALFEAHPNPMWVFDAETLDFLAVNDAMVAQYGYSRGELLTMTAAQIRAPEEVPHLLATITPLPPGIHHAGIWRHRHKNGGEMLMEITFHALDFGNRRAVAVMANNVTERVRVEVESALTAKVLEQGSEGIIICNAQRVILTVNRALCETTGYSAEELIGSNPRVLGSNRHDRAFYRQMWAEVEQHGSWEGEVWNQRKNGEVYPERLSISTLRNAEGEVTHYVGIASDLSEAKATEAHIRHLAQHDALTGLPNRSLLQDRVQQAISVAQRHRHSVALLFLDVDRFKNVNDSLGHQIGDQLLIMIAERLKAELRAEDTVSRLGGDDFVVLLPDTHADGAAHVADKLLRSLGKPLQAGETELLITASIGIAVHPANGDTVEALLQSADSAMYRAKEGGRNTFRFFNAEMHSHSSRTLQLENALRRAQERDQLRLVYQPQLDIASGRVIGCEALLRWHHPELGSVSPAEFIPIAEESGLILPIGAWVLRTAARQARQWQVAGLPPLVMAVNISAVQFHHADLTSLVAQVLTETGLAPGCLELELTESVAMKDPEKAIRLIHGLSQRGIQLSIDDFGTGYSSLSYLKRLNVSKLKIDQSFVGDIARDPHGEAIVGAVITLAASLGLETIAEGVETSVQLDFLREKGCHQVQGYHVSRPLTPEAFAEFLRQRPASAP